MAVRAYFVAVSTDTLARLRNEPETLLEYLYPNDGQDEPPNCVDLDKAWQGAYTTCSPVKPKAGRSRSAWPFSAAKCLVRTMWAGSPLDS
jgi:hypothetical protein